VASETQKLTDRAAYDAIVQIQPRLAVVIKEMVEMGVKNYQLARMAKAFGATPLLLNLVESAAAHLRNESAARAMGGNRES
jgi:hypothetical protein